MPNTIPIHAFTKHEKVLQVLEDCKKTNTGKIYSDITDTKGNQYVDLVLEGGGTLGIALLGYIYVLEQMGVRFLNIAGTSAGSIAALLLATGPIAEAKSEWIIQQLANKKFIDFVDLADDDDDSDAKKLIKILTEDGNKLSKLLFEPHIWDNVYQICTSRYWGLAKGDNFRYWLESILLEKNVKTLKDLKQSRSVVPKGFQRRKSHERGQELFNKTITDESLAFIAAEITTETKFVFPKNAAMIWEDTDSVSPVEFVRASMSIPLFFEPYKATHVHRKDLWAAENYHGKLPLQLIFIDGGIISNFPINIFHANAVPSAPTFGVKLGLSRHDYHRIENLADLLLNSFNTARHALDNDFVLNNEDYKHIVKEIPITKGVSWLNFNMSRKEQLDLFYSGAVAAKDFLSHFDWEKYKNIRQNRIGKI